MKGWIWIPVVGLIATGSYWLGTSNSNSPSPENQAPALFELKTNSSSSVFVDRDCGDFSTHAQAQAFYKSEGGPYSDPHDLDRDRDGSACETLP